MQTQNSRVFGISVRDRLGDSGIVGLMVLKLSSEASEIDTLLMSCRVLGRNVETGILAYAVNLSRLAGAKRLRGWYIPTAKNSMVRDLYERHGFTLIGHEEEAEVWEAELLGFELAAPAWAEVQEYQETGAQL